MRSTQEELIKKGVLMPDGSDKNQDSKINVSLLNLPDVEEVPSHDGEIVLSVLTEPPISLNDIGHSSRPHEDSLSVPSFLYVSDSPLVPMEKRNKYRCGQRTVRLAVVESVVESSSN
ncbi:hypothetical protein TNCV_109741 [Trichonephila clavipes]|nr:hypothetical protein TNCV_109741 [Trichonephila clavipes]